jgi:predicted aspartyl protease
MFSLLMAAACTQKADPLPNASTLSELKLLQDRKEYFKLAAFWEANKSGLKDEYRLFFSAVIDNKFNKNEACIATVDSLIRQYPGKLPGKEMSVLYRMESDSYFKLSRYRDALMADSNILIHLRSSITKDDAEDIENDLKRLDGLKDTPPQQAEIGKPVPIAWKRDRIGLIELPLLINGHSCDGIFDTRANISSISETFARKLGLRILNASYDEAGGITGIKFKTSIGIADSLVLGNVRVKNAVFQVMPDSVLYIAAIKFRLDIILGLPVIAQCREIRVFRNGVMSIPDSLPNEGLHNLALDDLDPVVLLTTGNDSLSFDFDSGAATSDFYDTYFEKYRKDIEGKAVKKTLEYGGAGGSQKKEVYVLHDFHADLGGTPVFMDSVTVLTKKIYPGERLYGNLGQDFMSNFSELILNFKYMYIKGVGNEKK